MIEIEPYMGKPDINRLIGAFRHEQIDRVPNFEILLEDQHVTKLLGREAGNTLAVGGDPAKGIEEAEGARPMLPEDYIEICNLIGQDAIAVEAIWTPFKKMKNDKLVMVGDRSIKTRDDFKKLTMPNDSDIEPHIEYLRQYKEAVKDTDIGVMMLFGAFFQTIYEFLFNMNDFLLLIHDDRDFVEELLDISADYWVKFVKAVLAEGVDVMFPAADVAGSSHSIVNYIPHENFIAMINAIHKYGNY